MQLISLRKIIQATLLISVTFSSSSSFIHSRQRRGAGASSESATTAESSSKLFTLSAPFTFTSSAVKMDSTTTFDSNTGTGTGTCADTPQTDSTPGKNIHTHYVFLIHGWLGNSSEMSYLETSINTAADAYVYSNKNKSMPSIDTNKQVRHHTSRLVTHSATSNNGRTTDGIASGGTRLAHEIQQVIKNDIQNNTGDNSGSVDDSSNEHHVSISFVGNSLGGLYARYALSKLPSKIHMNVNVNLGGNKEGEEEVQEKAQPKSSVILHPEIFATTATPHLGVASNTFLPIPRALEHIIGRTLQITGKDLFRIDGEDLIYQMCTNYESYLKPLTMFRKRIAYINAFRTDFQVPTGTAAFLNRNSTYPHSIRTNDYGGERDPPFIVSVANTEANWDILKDENFEDHTPTRTRMHAMSIKLDASGWEKVFVDVRKYSPIPGLALPSFLKKSSRQKWNEFLTSKQVEVQVGEESESDPKVVQVQSRELEKLMTGSDRIDIPVGHQVMVANSKSDAYSNFTKNGRPVMDHLAQQIVKTLFR